MKLIEVKNPVRAREIVIQFLPPKSWGYDVCETVKIIIDSNGLA